MTFFTRFFSDTGQPFSGHMKDFCETYLREGGDDTKIEDLMAEVRVVSFSL